MLSGAILLLLLCCGKRLTGICKCTHLAFSATGSKRGGEGCAQVRQREILCVSVLPELLPYLMYV